MTVKEVNISEELKALEKKKCALEKVIKIARAVEQLRYGLEAVVLLGKPTARIPPQVLQKFTALSENFRIQPTTKIQQSIKYLDANIANKINAIIELARPENHAVLKQQITSDDELAGQIAKLIQDYRKNSQAAVALRVVLRERGVRTVPIKWSINTDCVRTQISELTKQESNYRGKVKSNIVQLQKDAQVVAGNADLPQATRNAATHMNKMLQNNLQHLDDGKDIESMPFFVEVVELSLESAEPAKPKAPPPPATMNIHSTPVASKNKSGLMHKLWRWSTTPPSVTWDAIENQSKKDD